MVIAHLLDMDSILNLIREENTTFRAEYISSVDVFKQFDQEYANIVRCIRTRSSKISTNEMYIYGL